MVTFYNKLLKYEGAIADFAGLGVFFHVGHYGFLVTVNEVELLGNLFWQLRFTHNLNDNSSLSWVNVRFHEHQRLPCPKLHLALDNW